jgi:hypothetical protein
MWVTRMALAFVTSRFAPPEYQVKSGAIAFQVFPARMQTGRIGDPTIGSQATSKSTHPNLVRPQQVVQCPMDGTKKSAALLLAHRVAERFGRAVQVLILPAVVGRHRAHILRRNHRFLPAPQHALVVSVGPFASNTRSWAIGSPWRSCLLKLKSPGSTCAHSACVAWRCVMSGPATIVSRATACPRYRPYQSTCIAFAPALGLMKG